MTSTRSIAARSWILLLLTVAAAAFAWKASTPAGPQMPRWLNYQGRLTTPGGGPVQDGVYTANFKVFDSGTVGGQELWSESNVSVTVQDGLFSVSLGRSNPFPADLFSRPLWLQTEIDGRVLTPRQEIGAVAFAMTSHSVGPNGVATESIQNLSVTTAKIQDEAVTAEKLADGVAIPVGGVIAWYGNSAQAPAGWQVCDGSAVNDPSSPLNGSQTPDLRNRFIRGATGDVSGGAPTGGADSHTLTVAQMPSHSHGVNDPGHAHFSEGSGGFVNGNTRYAGGTGTSWMWTHVATTGITIQNTGGGQPFPLVPPYVGLVYIMRIR